MSKIEDKINNAITTDPDISIEHLKDLCYSLYGQVVEKNERISELNMQLYDGRHYLMSVEPDEITVEDSLEAFGFGRNGLRSGV